MKRDRRDSEQGKGPPARPSIISEKDRARLAGEARRLAYESIRRQLQFKPYNWCGCAAGRLVRRARVATEERAIAHAAMEIGTRMGIPISEATFSYAYGDRLALAVPLLSLADALDEASGTARGARPQQPTPSPKASP